MSRTINPAVSLNQASLPGIVTAPVLDRQLARFLSERVSADARLSFARGFTAAVVRAYVEAIGGRRVHPIPANSLLAPLDASAEAAAVRLGNGIAWSREAAHLIGAVYTSALPDDYRTRHGIFYTPPGLVNRLLDMAEAAGTNWRTARVLDPACGGGAFLVSVAKRMMTVLADVEPALLLKQIGRRLRGFELDPFGAWLAQAMLDITLADLGDRAGRPVPTMVEARDSLDVRPSEQGDFDLVVGNPPYGRITLAPAERAVFARSIYGHANLYGLFTDAALRWIARGGIVGYVTPTSMLSGLYHKALRALLVRQAPPLALDLLAERAGVFDDVLQETMLTVYRQGSAERVGRVGFLTLAADGQVTAHHAGAFTLPQNPEAPWLLPRAPDQVALTRRLRTMPHRLADHGYGVSTGPLVWNRHKRQLGATKRVEGYPVIWAESVSADGRFSWRAARRNHAPWFRAKLPRDAWLLVERPCALLQRTTAKEQARRLIAAELPEVFIRSFGAVVVENHLNMVRTIVPIPTVPVAAIVALLNSAAADAAFRCINGSVAVSAYELEGMPVPSPAVMQAVAELVRNNAPRIEIEALIAEAYREEAGVDAAAD